MANEVDISSSLTTRYEALLKELQEAKPFLKEQYQQKLLSIVEALSKSEEGIEFLYTHIDTLTQAGFFRESSWEDPAKLVPSLVGGTLKGNFPEATFELASELRMLAYATGKVHSESITAEEAQDFLEQVMVHNLDLIFPESTEALRETVSEVNLSIARNLFRFIVREIPIENIKPHLIEEVQLICAQRPIVTSRAKDIIRFIKEHFSLDEEDGEDQKLLEFIHAVYGPTGQARSNSDFDHYNGYLQTASDAALKEECRAFGKAMQKTGLVSDQHAILIHYIKEQHPELLKELLHLDENGQAELKKHFEFVELLIDHTISPANSRSIYGLARLLERGLLSRQPVMNGLKKLLDLRIHPEVERHLLRSKSGQEITPVEMLLGGTVDVLGIPLGIGQGNNPTCQAARGISLWSQYAPGKLLSYIRVAAQENLLEFRFEGELLRSDELPEGLASELDYSLDPVSLVLVPHLDKLYNEMMRRASLRGEDPHKWVNPALYGHWIPTGFRSAFDQTTQSVQQFDEFVRTFYRAHHPSYNGGHDLAYPNPVGIFITTSQAELLGFHAVSLLRIAEDPGGTLRAYFLNPNNEGRQNWGQGIQPAVFGNGEVPGESSLPFEQFASRLYAFHYNTSGYDPETPVDEQEVKQVVQLAKESWGRSYVWQ